MKIIFYLGHPAQFHFSKNIIKQLSNNGHEVKILLKTKDVLEDLVKRSGLEYKNIQASVRKNNRPSILFSSFKRTIEVLKIAKQFKADILVGTDSSIAQAAYLLRKPSLTVLEDDYAVVKNLAKLTYPFSSSIVVPSCCDVGKKWSKKKIPYSGYMKLAYLHPIYFIPNKSILNKISVTNKYLIIRLSQLNAHHDYGIKGLNNKIITDLIQIIESKGYTVYISSESIISQNFKKYQLNIPPDKIHDIMAFASLLISDSQSMSVEAAILGVPSIRFNDFSGKISVLEELEHTYKLTFGIPASEPGRLIDLVNEILNDENTENTFKKRRDIMLSEKIDVTAFFVWVIENYPESKEIMKKNPDYQYKFK